MVKHVARDGIPVVAIGLLVGLASSLGLTRLMSSIVYGVSANDGATLLAVSAALTATAILAVYISARRCAWILWRRSDTNNVNGALSRQGI
jgi:putative ABC transport system permease protein